MEFVMKFTLSLLLACVFFMGTAYAPKTPAKAPAKTLDQNYAEALPKVEAAPWPASGDAEKPNTANKSHVIQAATCLPKPKGQKVTHKWSNHMGRCVQMA
jgi:hypothetical protein